MRGWFGPSGGDPVHHPSQMPHPSYWGSFPEKLLNPCSQYADLAPPNIHTLFLTPAAWRPSPNLQGSSCLLTGHFLHNTIPSHPQVGGSSGLWKAQL